MLATSTSLSGHAITEAGLADSPLLFAAALSHDIEAGTGPDAPVGCVAPHPPEQRSRGGAVLPSVSDDGS